MHKTEGMIDEKCIHPPLKKKKLEPSLYSLCVHYMVV